MFDLKFYSSVLDKMPVGTSFSDSDHVITKKDEGWECDDCASSTTYSSSSGYMSDSSEKYALVKFAGSEIDPDNLDPRLLSFLPAGTRVADCDTLSSNNWFWHKTKAGIWVWDESREGAETAASNGVGVGDMVGNDHLRPFRLHSVGTDEAPESDETPTDPARSYDIDELNLIDNKILLDHDGDRWVKVGDKWYILYSNGIGGLPWGHNLNPSYGPYEIAEEFQEITAQQAETLKGKVLVDREGDLWAFVDDSWRFKSGAGFIKFAGQDAFGSYGPLTLYHDQSVHPESSEVPKSDATPAAPGGLTAAEATTVRDAVYDNGGGKWVYTSEGGYRLKLGGNLLGTLREQLPADYAPYFTEDPRAKSAPEPEPEPEPEEIPEGKTNFTASEATNFKDCRFRDRHDDVWLFDEETERWRFIRSDGTLSCLFRYERLDAFLEPYVLVEGETEVETEPETEVDPAEELSAEQANEKRDFVLSDTDDDKWTYSDGNWHCEGHEHLSVTRLPDMFEPYEVVEPVEAPEPEAEPAVKTMLSAKEASEHKDTVFEDSDGDAWFFDYGLQRWRGIGRDWAYAKEELEPLFSPYNEVGPLSEYDRTWTAREANDLKDNALEDRDGDIWIYDAPSEMWKCSHSSALDYAELDEAFQPYRIKKAASSTAAPKAFALGFDEPFQLSGDTEEVTFEGSAREAVELLDRIARSLESISNKLGDK